MARQSRRRSGVPGTGAEVGIARRGRHEAWLRRQQSAQPTVPVAYVVPAAGREATIADQIASGNLPRVEALIRESAAG